MSCECSFASSSSSDDAYLKLMFGPLYSKYKDANLYYEGPPRSYSAKDKLSPLYTNECCENLSPDWTAGPQWKGYALILGLWSLYTLGLFCMLFRIRHDQLVKIRDIRVICASTTCLAILLFTILSEGMWYGTDPKYLTPVFLAIFLPQFSFLPIIRTLHALFIYKWHEAKAMSISLQWFSRLKFILGIRFYFAMSLFVLLFVSLPMILTLLWSPVFTESGSNSFATVRCWWWHIPDEYTQATTNSTLCGCIHATFSNEGDATSVCETGLLRTCFSGLALLDSEATVCSACESESLSECKSAFFDFYTSGACGWPKRTPDFDSCFIGIFSVHPLAHGLFGISAGFVAVNMLAMLPIMFKRDYFGIVVENTINIVTNVLVLVSVFLQLEERQLLDWWTYDIPLYLPISVVCFSISSATSLGLPVILYYYRRKHGLTVIDVQSRVEGSSVTEASSPHADESLIYNTRNAREISLQRCIASQPHKAVYLKFSIDEFTTENVRFLDECMRFIRDCDVTENNDVGLLEAAQSLYDQFIAAGADMEINVSSKLRTELAQRLAALKFTDTHAEIRRSILNLQSPDTTFAPLHAAPTFEEKMHTQQHLVESFRSVFGEIVRLMSTSSWPRFEKSRYYPEYLAVTAMQKRRISLDLHVKAWLGDDQPIEMTHRPRSPVSTPPSTPSLLRDPAPSPTGSRFRPSSASGFRDPEPESPSAGLDSPI